MDQSFLPAAAPTVHHLTTAQSTLQNYYNFITYQSFQCSAWWLTVFFYQVLFTNKYSYLGTYSVQMSSRPKVYTPKTTSYHYQLQSWRPSAVIWCSHGSICIMDLPTLWTIQFLHVKGCYRLRVGPCWHSNEFACMDSVLAYCQCAATVTAAHTVGEPCWHGTYTRTVVVVSGMQLRIA